MGEYATIKASGERVKIGTCKSLYYLRFDQRELVEPEAGWPDIYRYRFPFPDEDDAPHRGHGGDRPLRARSNSLRIEPPIHLEHHSVQFRCESIGYNVLPTLPRSPSRKRTEPARIRQSTSGA